jgi:hypothetical protein
MGCDKDVLVVPEAGVWFVFKLSDVDIEGNTPRNSRRVIWGRSKSTDSFFSSPGTKKFDLMWIRMIDLVSAGSPSPADGIILYTIPHRPCQILNPSVDV